jgi:uncharacterized protein (DUF924 family)
MSDIAAIWDFWFAPAHEAKWYEKDAAFDAEIRARFGKLHEAAAAGALDHWPVSAHGALALILLLDQFSRNLHRNDPRAFAGDAKALAVAELAVSRGFDRGFPFKAQQFFYLPFEHAEDLAAQQRCIELFTACANDEGLKYAIAHRDIIARFGRFPHRNAALGRTTTAEEIEFLKGPNSSF